MTPWEKYQQDLNRDDFNYDAAQENAVKELQRLYEDLLSVPQNATGWRAKIRRVWDKPAHTTIKGIYFWGGVGRGKTYLVDTFYECLPFEKKMRTHFHRFMHRIHDELKQSAGEQDPLLKIATKLAKETRIICFDEFFVSDITDAMILGTLMEALLAQGIVLVATSNIVPDDLYKNGLQRARFLPAIKLINERTVVVNVDSGVDYRLRTLEQAEIYHFPLDKAANENLHVYFEQLSCELGEMGVPIEINNRSIPVVRYSDGVLMITFDDLCGGPRGQTDYIELSRLYHTVLIADVKQMGGQNDDAARRFIAMIDEFYERHVKVIMSAEVDMPYLYSEGRLNFEFQRCLSRLQEMQSTDYLKKEHLP